MKDETIISHLRGELNPKEMREVEIWINASQENEIYYNKVKFIWENSVLNDNELTIDAGKAWNKIQSSISIEEIKTRKKVSITRITILKVAAAAAIVIGLGYLTSRIFIQPYTYRMEWVTERTTMSKANFILSDGSQVWLNRNSEITYPMHFRGQARIVTLKGEAFFDVAENSRKPFIVHAGRSITQVLGTTFNLEANSELSGITVTVVTGKVVLSDSADTGNRIVLEPGDQGIFNPSSGSLMKRKNDDTNFLAWKTDVLIFDRTPLDQVCNTLTRYYNKQFILDGDEVLKGRSLTATYDNKGLDEILEILQITLDISYRYNGNRIVIRQN